MDIGMKRGTVFLVEHQPAWEREAQETIAEIQAALEGLNADVEHVGSTSVKSIRAKPIIDIAVAVDDFDEVISRSERLAKHHIVFRKNASPEQLLYVKGDCEADTRTHHIHVVLKGSGEWKNYLNFRDYLNANGRAALEYEAVKARLAEMYPNDRGAYTAGKGETVSRLLREAAIWRGQNPEE